MVVTPRNRMRDQARKVLAGDLSRLARIKAIWEDTRRLIGLHVVASGIPKTLEDTQLIETAREAMLRAIVEGKPEEQLQMWSLLSVKLWNPMGLTP